MKSLLTTISFCLLATSAFAEGPTRTELNSQTLPVEPGRWQVIIDIETDGKNNREPLEIEDEQVRFDICVTFDEAFMRPKDLIEQSCVVSGVRVADDPRLRTQGLAFDIACDMHGIDMEGDYILSRNADGDQVMGEMQMGGRQRGLSIDVASTIRGRRTGQCRG